PGSRRGCRPPRSCRDGKETSPRSPSEGNALSPPRCRRDPSGGPPGRTGLPPPDTWGILTPASRLRRLPSSSHTSRGPFHANRADLPTPELSHPSGIVPVVSQGNDIRLGSERHPPADPVRRVVLGGPEEWDRAIADTDGPQLVLAGPGTGKTQFLARRFAHL